MIEDYQPIDYKNWVLGDEAREGINIKRLNILTSEELKIWEEAVPYQDQRNDPGHGEITTYFAVKLLDHLPGRREIVIPDAICHDIGWTGNDPNAWKELIEKHKDNLQALEGEANRRPHQNRGILLTGIVLERTGYFDRHSIDSWLEIADIIGDHDTKKLPTTDSGRILRSADFIWRATYPLVEIYMPDFKPKQLIERIEETCLYEPNSPLGEVELGIAKIELANTILFKFGEAEAREVLGEKYGYQLEEIKKLRSKD